MGVGVGLWAWVGCVRLRGVCGWLSGWWVRRGIRVHGLWRCCALLMELMCCAGGVIMFGTWDRTMGELDPDSSPSGSSSSSTAVIHCEPA